MFLTKDLSTQYIPKNLNLDIQFPHQARSLLSTPIFPFSLLPFLAMQMLAHVLFFHISILGRRIYLVISSFFVLGSFVSKIIILVKMLSASVFVRIRIAISLSLI